MGEKIKPPSFTDTESAAEREPIEVPTYTDTNKDSELMNFLAHEDIKNLIEENNLPRPYWSHFSQNPNAQIDSEHSKSANVHASLASNPSRILLYDKFFNESFARQQRIFAEELIHLEDKLSGKLDFVTNARQAIWERTDINSDLRKSLVSMFSEPIELSAHERLIKILPSEEVKLLHDRITRDIESLEKFKIKQRESGGAIRGDLLLVDMLKYHYRYDRLYQILKNNKQPKLAKKYRHGVKITDEFINITMKRWAGKHPKIQSLRNSIDKTRSSRKHQDYIEACQDLTNSIA